MRNYFYGWYLKCQSPTDTLAIIPSYHKTSSGSYCSLQLITEETSYSVRLPAGQYQKRGGCLVLGDNIFCKKGVILNLHVSGLDLSGKLHFDRLTPLCYDIMGPFSLIPFLECRHSVYSMRHSVSGALSVNGQKHVFRSAEGYWEGDRGYSFPKAYAWTHCFFPGGSLMLSAADIPMAGFHFTGVICVILWKGRQYRLATYLGAKAAVFENGRIVIRQGDYQLEARLLETTGKPLKAHVSGEMKRTIRENAACRAFYQFQKGNHILLSFETDMASFEYESGAYNRSPIRM